MIKYIKKNLTYDHNDFQSHEHTEGVFQDDPLYDALFL